jgi:hypothetical protein
VTAPDRLCETRWLQRVFEAMMDCAQPDSPASLADLRTRIAELAWADDAPKAAAFVSAGEDDRFRRHPLATVEATGCSALLMYWPAGHATLPHDHDGLWGIEVVIDGQLDVEEYVKSGSAQQPTLTFARALHLGAGDAATFRGRQYVHRCRNLSNVSPTLTLHLYGGMLEAFTSYERDDSGRLVPVRQVPRSDRALS